MASKEKYSLIKPGKSHDTINPSIGCNHICVYCNGKRNPYTERHSPEETLSTILNSREIVKDKNSLLLYGFSDPFLPQNSNSLVKILEGLDNLGWSNKVSLITKINPGKEVLDNLETLKNLKLAVFVSYTNMIPSIESPSAEGRIKLMYSLHDRGINVVSYLSPLVKEWTPMENIEELAKDIDGHVNAVTLSGITLTPQIISELQEKEIVVPHTSCLGKKYDDENFFKRVEETINSMTGLPTFRSAFKTISYL